MGLFGCLRCLVKWTIIISIAVFLINTWLKSKSYTFSEQSVAAIARKYADKGTARVEDGYNVENAFRLIHADFRKTFPGHILPEADLQWMMFNAGGWMGAVCVIHASITEYVLFFGAAIETEGHSGRYWANITDTLIVGEMAHWKEGEFSAILYKPGDTVYHPVGEVTEVNFKANTWMVEYGRGFIPSTLTFGLADTFFSTTDFVSLFYVLRAYAKSLWMEANYYAAHINEMYT